MDNPPQIVLPCLDEADALPATLAALEKVMKAAGVPVPPRTKLENTRRGFDNR